jgi:hypothetical protein
MLLKEQELRLLAPLPLRNLLKVVDVLPDQPPGGALFLGAEYELPPCTEANRRPAFEL